MENNESLRKKTLRGVFWSFIDRFSVTGISFLFSLVLARLLMPSDYGLIAMINIFLAISQTFIDCGFSNALIRKNDRTEVDYCTVFYFNIVVSALCYIILFFSSPFIADFYNAPELKSIIRVVALCFIFSSFCQVQGTILSIKLDFKTPAKISFLSNLLFGLVAIYMAFRGYGVWSLVVQSVGASFMHCCLICWAVKWKPTEKFSYQSFRYFFSFGSKLLVSGLLDTIYNNLYAIVIGKKFTAADLGLYSKGRSWGEFLSVWVTKVISSVSYPVLSTIQNEDDRLALNYRKFIRLSAFIIFPLMMGLAAVADPLTRFILTDKWEDSILIMQILCFSLMWYPIHAINLNLLLVKGRSDLFLKLEIYKKILGVVILCVTVPHGIIAMCYGTIVGSILGLVLNTYYTGKLINFGFLKQMRDLFPTLAISLIMGGLVYFVIGFFDANLLKLVVGVILGGLIYISINYLFKPMEWNELLLILRKK